jgi:hypothetical protein
MQQHKTSPTGDYQKEDAMKQNRFFAGIVIFIALALLLNACAKPPSLTITYHADGTCAFDGPTSIPYGKFSVTWIIEPKEDPQYGYEFVSLKDNKTLSDLEAASWNPPPAWTVQLMEGFSSGGTTVTHQQNLEDYSIRYQGGPLYIICFNHQDKSGVLGPIEVTK